MPELEANQEPQYVGMINARMLQDALSASKVGLTKLQVTSVMCEAEILDSMIDYWKFVPVAANTIEQMTDPQSGGAHTAHTTNLVPFVACSDALVGRSLKSGGRLCDIATTLLPLLGLEKSPEMEGVDLLV